MNFSYLEAPGNAVLAPTFKLFKFRPFFLLVAILSVFCFFFLSIKNVFIGAKTPKPPKQEIEI